MLGISYLKVAPTTFVRHYVGGKLRKEGAGLSFFYFAPFGEIVLIPLAATDSPFVFNETTADFQEVSIQGQITYRVVDAARLSEMLDFSVRPNGQYRNDDPRKLPERITNAAQILSRGYTQKKLLHELLSDAEGIISVVREGLRSSSILAGLGIEVTEFHIVSIKATPEMTKALQANAREEQLRKADEALFARRNASVNMERTIRENELNTEILVEEKQRQVREAQISADIAVEEQRAKLVDHKVANERKEAEARAFALNATLEPLKAVDWKVLAAAMGGGDARQNIGLAFRELAENASRIGQLNISPDLLATLLRPEE
jgi:regulator of protease activity HflC (stomatin/prohibitin superfamily)